MMNDENVIRNPEPFFIVGCPRSGTSLLQVLLDAHPHLTIPPESHVFNHFPDPEGRYGDLGRPANRRRFVRDLLADARIRTWGMRIDPATFCAGLTADTPAGVFDRLFGLYASGQNKRRWGEKTPSHVFHLAAIRRSFPRARIIHVLRDGRDAAESMRRAVFGPWSIAALARRWASSVNAFRSFAAADAADLTLEVRYEELVRHCAAAIDRVLAFLGEPAMETGGAMPLSPLRSHYVAAHPYQASLGGPVSLDRVGRYRSRLSRREIAIFEQIAGRTLAACGYPLETAPAQRAPLHPAERARFVLQDRVWRYLRKLHRPAVVRLDVTYAWQGWGRALRGAGRRLTGVGMKTGKRP